MSDEQGECEVMHGEYPDPMKRICSKPAVLRYPAMGGGHMRLCAEHGAKHESYCERWTTVGWQKRPRHAAAGDDFQAEPPTR